MSTRIILGFIIGLILFLAIVFNCHYTQKSYQTLLQINRHIIEMTQAIKNLDESLKNPATSSRCVASGHLVADVEKENKHTPIPKIKT